MFLNNSKLQKTLRTAVLVSFCTALFFTFTLSSYAQISGYQGKRFLIGFSLPMSAGYDLKSENFYYATPKGAAQLKDISWFYYRVKPTVYLEYVVNRKSSFQVFSRFMSSKIDIKPIGIKNSVYYPTDRMNVNSIAMGLKYKLFIGANINPIGHYFAISIEYITSTYDSEGVKFYTDDYKKAYTMNKEVAGSFVPSISLGNQSPLGSHLLLDIGLETGLPIATIINNAQSFIPLLDDLELYYVEYQDWAKVNVGNHLFRSYIVSFKIGITILP